ncbi:hypothetical protein D3C72_785230 [compost metagenome]
MVGMRIAVPVGFIGAYRVFVPFAGKDTLTADGLEAVADPTDTGEQVDKAESIIGMNGWRARQQILQVDEFPLAKTVPCPLAGDQSLQDRRTPVAFTLRIQVIDQRFRIIDGQQFA